ncbi:MAG TPA: hypothetical protein VL360_07125 [Gammaproteobacteria bacterium]|jgi:hypothetical protein|nr:hypothetical protein [Gammaproteobacteria bacterium]
MQRFFHATDAVEETSSDSWYSTLSTAAGWLNPFNITRNGVSTTFIASFIFLKNITTATAVSCFKIVSDLAANEVPYYKLDCMSSWRERHIISVITTDPRLNATAISCSQYQLLDTVVGEVIGHGYFQPNYYSEETALCKMERTQNIITINSERLNYELRQTIHRNVNDGWGSKLDYKITLGLAIPFGLIVTTGALLTTLFFVRQSQWNKNRRINNKCHPLTKALAENDAVLLDNLKEMAIESDIVLPKEIMFYILQQTNGYDDAKYKRKYFSSDAHNPCPEGFESIDDNGKPAPFIRFCDTLARDNYRKRSLNRHWKDKDVKKDMRDRVNAALVEVIVDDESAPILNNNNKMI